MSRQFVSAILCSIFLVASTSHGFQTLQLKMCDPSIKQTQKNQRILDMNDNNLTIHVASGISYLISIDSNTLMYPIISSHNTGFSDGACPWFETFECSSPSCTEDNSVLESEESGVLSFTAASRLSITELNISLADGAWQLNNSPLYIHNCNYTSYVRPFLAVRGWIGFGLGAGANKNYQASNPVFSILFNSTTKDGEIIFGYHPNYTDSSVKPIVLFSDPDWKLHATSCFFGNSSLTNNPTVLVFTLDHSVISLSTSLYHNLKNIFEGMQNLKNCQDHKTSFLCNFEGNLAELPPLKFTFQDDTQFLLQPIDYMIPGPQNVYFSRFSLLNNSKPGIAYITFGTRILNHYYTVFQQHPNQTHTITLHPYALGLESKSEEDLPSSSINNSEQSQTIHYVEDNTFNKDLVVPIASSGWPTTVALSGFELVIDISSHNTGFGDGSCPLFFKYDCLSPSCIEDKSISESSNHSFFATKDATRIKLTGLDISIAKGAWQFKDSPIFIHNCNNYTSSHKTGGWIGLGLGGGANKNYRDSNPIFSVMMNPITQTGELIFGLKANYIDTSVKPILLFSDLDWKLQATNVSIGNYSLSNSSVTVVFDIQRLFLSVTTTSYQILKNLFFNELKMDHCDEEDDVFRCFRFTNSLTGLPPLILNFQESQLVIPPEVYMLKQDLTRVAQFRLLNNSDTGTDFIVLGFGMMYHYYTVFQQTSDKMHTITLFPYVSGLFEAHAAREGFLVSPISDSSEGQDSLQSNSSEPKSNNKTQPSVNNTQKSEIIPENLTSNNMSNFEQNNTSEPIANSTQISDPFQEAPDQNANNSKEATSTQDTLVIEDDNESNHTVVFVIIGIILVCLILICLRRTLIRNKYWRKDTTLVSEFYKDQMANEQNETENENINDI